MLRWLFGKKQQQDADVTHRWQQQTCRSEHEHIPISDCTFSVVDLETTGFSPRTGDRIVEIAIINVDSDGKLIDEFVTLINPERDVGPTHVHGITEQDIFEAPRFSDIAGDIVKLLAGNVLVGHNVRFDADFLKHEFARQGHIIPQLAMLCTLRLARRVNGSLRSYRLKALCKHYTIPYERAHSALEDAHAVARLLRVFLEEGKEKGWQTLADHGCTTRPAPPQAWPVISTSGRTKKRADTVSPQASSSYLINLINRSANPILKSPEMLEYVALLDRVLEDRNISSDEARSLTETANRLGLSSRDIYAIHGKYLEALLAQAAEDGIITVSERQDLYQAAGLLGYDTSHVDALLRGRSLA